MRKKKWIALGAVVLVGAGLYAFFAREDSLAPQDFEMIPVERGDIVQQVTASGKIQPINTVSVGTQVSGIVERVLVDYNDEVAAGQLLAELDTSVLLENRNDTQARLDLARAKQQIARLNHTRIEKLYQDKLVAKASLEEAEIARLSADADVLIAEANYNIAERNYGYASIVSPVSGTVISKEVEQGQTVAASLQAPILFKIAEDLSKMQIEANIAEADIGMIRSGMEVSFSVDAHPTDTFGGAVQQIRLSPTEEQNVVMYTVVIEVDNSSRKLLPGMTAFVNIEIQSAHDVLRLPTAALQFKPNAFVRQFLDKKRLDLQPNQAMVYQLSGGKIVPRVFTRGLADTSHVEVRDGLSAGEAVIGEFLQRGAAKR